MKGVRTACSSGTIEWPSGERLLAHLEELERAIR